MPLQMFVGVVAVMVLKNIGGPDPGLVLGIDFQAVAVPSVAGIANEIGDAVAIIEGCIHDLEVRYAFRKLGSVMES